MKKSNPIKPQGEEQHAFRTITTVILISLIVSGCTGVPAMLKPAGVTASRISDLTVTIMIIAATVFVVVEALLIITAIRFRSRPSAAIPKQIAGNVPLEIAWTSFPAVVLAVVFALTLGTLFSISNTPAQSTNNSQPTKVLNVVIIGHQWWWEFQYPGLGITTANEMHIPVDATVNMQLESADVIHSFWIPEMGNKVDAIPGLQNHLWYRATTPGRFEGQCSEFCGVEHALMRMTVVAETPDEFLAWMAEQKKPAPSNLTGKAALGQQAFLDSPCAACHTIDGTKAQGKVGPNLTHFGSRARFAGDSFDNTHENVTNWIMNPQALKPGNHMPNLGMTPTVSSQIATFLESLK